MARLRQGGLPDCVVVDGGHLQVTVPSDYTEFRELLVANRVREAVERYRGPFLHGFTMPARRGRASAVDSSVETWVHSVRRETADAVTLHDIYVRTVSGAEAPAEEVIA